MNCYFAQDSVSAFIFSINSSKNNYQNNLHINNHAYKACSAEYVCMYVLCFVWPDYKSKSKLPSEDSKVFVKWPPVFSKPMRLWFSSHPSPHFIQSFQSLLSMIKYLVYWFCSLLLLTDISILIIFPAHSYIFLYFSQISFLHNF